MSGITETLERSLFAEEISRQPGFFQLLDPRLKILFTLALLIAVSLARNVLVLGCIYCLLAVFAWMSAIPADFFFRRVWLAVLLFTGLIAVPALFLVPGKPLVALPFGLVVTASGAKSVLFLLMRVGCSVSSVLLLVMTTPWNTVIGALGVLRVPDVFILIFGMTFRYIYLLLHITNDMFLARKSRVIGRMSAAEERQMLAATGATLLGKSLSMSSEVYLAMVSRGYRGAVVTFKPFRMRRQDWFWSAVFMAVIVMTIVIGRWS